MGNWKRLAYTGDLLAGSEGRIERCLKKAEVERPDENAGSFVVSSMSRNMMDGVHERATWLLHPAVGV